MDVRALELEKAFKDAGNFVFREKEALAKCRQLAEEFKLNSTEVARQYDAYAAIRDASFDVTSSNMQAFGSFLSKEFAGKGHQAKPRIIAKAWDENAEMHTPKRATTEAAKNSGRQGYGSITPVSMGSTPTLPQRSPQPLTPGSSFHERLNKGQVLTTYNSNLPDVDTDRVSHHRTLPSFQLLGEQLVVPGVRHVHMTDTIEGKVHAINERIIEFGESLKRVLPEARDINTTSVAEVTQEALWVSGRVVAESDTGTLNAQSVLLEGSREASGGIRVKLDMGMLPSFRLFSGQVICAKGLNPTGSTFIAQQLITHIPKARQQIPTSQTITGLSMVIAAGPFTTSDNMQYQPLDELLKFCSGPFVDVEHPDIKDGSLDMTFDEVFQEQVLKRIGLWQREPSNQNCRVMLMPSVRDAHIVPVFPQPPMNSRESGDRLLTLENPCSFISEGLFVSASSHDILMHLSATEFSQSQGQDRMSALASHVIGQQHMYPLFPAPLGACLDVSHYSHLQLPCTPDLMLLPSNLAPFAKVISLSASQLAGGPMQSLPGVPEASVVVNPGRLTKGNSGGTFAHLILPSTVEGGVLHQQIRVDIRKI